ncbi:MAG TPA: ATPase domain-containing protein [Pyrinomonadaceae bacterium]|nr:ATPase domain-containing protein [Pyrinomonadaceae bacterium]
MDHEKNLSARHLIERCGGYGRAVDAAATFGRIAWELAFSADQLSANKPFREVDREQLFRRMQESCNGRQPDGARLITEFILDKLKAARPAVCRLAEDGGLLLGVSALQPMELARELLLHAEPEHELRYFLMRNIRRHYGCVLSAQTAHILRLLANTLNAMRAAHGEDDNKSDIREKPHPRWSYSKELWPRLHDAITSDAIFRSAAPETLPCNGDPGRIIQLFIECCRAVGYLRAHDYSQSIRMRTASIDFEYLLSNLFGVPSMISGFNELFGGGGMMLTESPSEAAGAGPRIDGRTVLVIGRFGTGKSLMAMQVAVDVARKGGVSWIMSLEQTADEYLYTLESMNAFPNDGTVTVATDATSLNAALKSKSDNGLIIILKSVKDSYEDFLKEMIDNNQLMQRYHLRLIVVDPVNSISKKECSDVTELRALTLDAINEVGRTGTNVLLVAEDETGPRRELSFEEKIADTVIRLSIDHRHHYAQRYFEVTKSRLQREQRGEHPFSIVPGAGVTIYPSTAAVRARIRSRGLRPTRMPVKFGHEDLDYILGEEALLGGDVVVFSGPEGALKREMGLLFLLEADIPRGDPTMQLRPLSLLVAARAEEFSYRHILESAFIRHHAKGDSPPDGSGIRICPLPSGYVNSGYIFQRLNYEFSRARAEGYWIDRVMVDSVNHWEISCPFVREDETFGDTLIDYLRRHGTTSLLICGDSSKYNNSVVQKSIISNADCLIQFNRFEIRGKHQVTFRVLRTRGMTHRRDLFDINLVRRASEISITPSLMRLAPNGEIKPVKVSLFLHSETNAQKQVYNELIVERIRGMLSPDAEIRTQDRAFISSKANLSYASTVDELQIYHLDEFQLPDPSESGSKDFPLHIFPASKWPKEWDSNFIPRLINRVKTRDGSFYGVPYYTNISLLAYEADRLKKAGGLKVLGSWELLAKACQRWEGRHPDPSELFFDFPKVTAENYNCLFWEILLSLSSPPSEPERLGTCHLREWIKGEAAVKACGIYRTLCRRAYFSDVKHSEVSYHQITTLKEPIDVSLKAVVWRHWYSTLNQMMSRPDGGEPRNIKVTHLPGMTAVAGEWFCAVPVHSAAPEIGLEIIKLLVSAEDDLERQQIGVGLPSRAGFYGDGSSPETLESPISPYFSVKANVLRKLVTYPFRRSNFGCYTDVFQTLSHYLRKIIEIPDGPESTVDEQIRDYLLSFWTTMGSFRTEWVCTKCCLPKSSKNKRHGQRER